MTGITENIRRYQVLITPLVDIGTYGDELDITSEIDISDEIKDRGIGRISREIDNGDYDIGVFTYGDITLTAFNLGGRFNPPGDPASIFLHSRDKAKVKINYLDILGNITISFHGLINEEATRQNILENEIKFKVLSIDSIMRKIKINSGQVGDGELASVAVNRLLGQVEVISVLNYLRDNVNLDTDIVIDNGGWFSNKSLKEGLDALMVATNSVLFTDGLDLIVGPRRESSTVHTFYGAGDLQGRENIEAIRNLNSGLHRTFNSIVIGDLEVSDDLNINFFGLRQKKISLDFITNIQSRNKIATRLLEYFKVPKTEMEITVSTESSLKVKMLDSIVIHAPRELVPAEGERYLTPLASFKIGVTKLPRIVRDFDIDPLALFKVIGIKENAESYTRTLKIKQRGSSISDGYFFGINNTLEFFQIGISRLEENPEYVNPNENARLCTARIGIMKLKQE